MTKCIPFLLRWRSRHPRAKTRCLFVVLGLSLLIAVPGGVAVAADDAAQEKIRAKLMENLPSLDIGSIEKTPIDGLYELISNGEIYYISADGEHIIDGDIINMNSRENLTSARKGGIHLGLINAVAEEDMLIYEPAEKSDRSVTVFTDISCGYCRKLHSELEELLDGGVRVRYLMFPRAGLGSQAHKDLESVWCADDPQEAMTTAKAGGAINPDSCSNPIDSHVALAEQVGLRGTPLIYLDNGVMVPGYRSAKQLVQMINDSKPL